MKQSPGELFRDAHALGAPQPFWIRAGHPKCSIESPPVIVIQTVGESLTWVLVLSLVLSILICKVGDRWGSLESTFSHCLTVYKGYKYKIHRRMLLLSSLAESHLPRGKAILPGPSRKQYCLCAFGVGCEREGNLAFLVPVYNKLEKPFQIN